MSDTRDKTKMLMSLYKPVAKRGSLSNKVDGKINVKIEVNKDRT